MKIKFKKLVEEDVKFIRAKCGRVYWEDAFVNGEQDDDGSRIPCRVGDCWCPLIEIERGIITNWSQGTIADIHFKVCDEGVYELLDADMKVVLRHDGYVPEIMCPGDIGYGDYVIMSVDGAGKIAKWNPNTLKHLVKQAEEQ